MNYYDEEISIGGPDTKNLSSIKVERLPSASGSIGARGGNRMGSARANASGVRTSANRGNHGRRQLHLQNSNDDDGLLHDIIDHDDDDDDEDDSELMKPPMSATNSTQKPAQSNTLRLQTTRPGSQRINHIPKSNSNVKGLDDDTDDLTDSESDEIIGQARGTTGGSSSAHNNATTHDVELSITPDKWENLGIHQDVKELFPYILKYTPQSIETQYHLQPFIPDYVPAVGDVDAFLKVTFPALLQPQRQHEVNEHLRKMGLYFLDEPSGQQSEPSLLNMKLRSVLTGSGAKSRSASAHLVPVAKSSKDIDKWIAEVEQVHMTQSVFDAQPLKDIEPLLLDWPRSFADAKGVLLDAYQRSLQDDLPLTDYIRLLCQKFEVDATYETQTDYVLNVQTLFALYLAANQAWE